MVSTVTKFRACDGSEWVRQSDAEDRERDTLRVKGVMSLIGDKPDIPSGEYYQHNSESLRLVKASIWKMVCESYGKSYPHWLEWTAEQVHPHSGVGRVLGDGSGPLEDAWSRFNSIDFNTAREYQQPYFALNPEKATVEME